MKEPENPKETPVGSPPGPASESVRERRTDIERDLSRVVAAQGGDAEAFADLVAQYQGLVLSLLAGRVRGRQDVEDLAQEVFLKAFRKLPDLREPERFAGWLSRIAVNATRDFHRRSKVRPKGVALEAVELEPEAGGPREDHAAIVSEEHGLVLEALHALDERSRLAVLLRYRDGMAVKEIADRMGDSPAAIGMRLTRALRALRKRME
ncbi:MAG: RNA polymerase sigma factor [Planctomycetota bacterium]